MAPRRARLALIPAAGRGTRFLPLTKSVPKELVPIVSTPVLELVVAEASRNGISDVLIVLGKGKRAIAEYFAADGDLESTLRHNGDEAGLASIRHAAELAVIHHIDQPEARGLGDAVACGEDFAGGEALAVLLPDDLIDEGDELLGTMLDLQAERGGMVLGLIDVPRPDIGKYGCAAPAAGADTAADVVAIAGLIEKPNPEDAPSTLALLGRYVLPPEIFDALRETGPGANDEIQLTDAMHRLACSGVPLTGVVFRGRRYDTGDRLGYVKAVVQLAGRHPQIGSDFTAWLREYVSGPE